MSHHQTPDKTSSDVAIAEISGAFGQATDATWLRTREWDFEALVVEYKRLETEFVARVGSSEVHVREIQRRITEIILQAAIEREESFATCQQWWDDLGRLGFSDIERRCTMTWFYGDACLAHGEFDAGLAVVKPLITELEISLASPTNTEPAKRFYQRELETLRKLQDELVAMRPGDSQ